MPSEYHISSITFEESGVVFSFARVDGIRKDGALQLMQSLFLGAHPDYLDDLDDLRSKAEEVLANALEDYTTADVVDLADDAESSEEEGMGFG